MGDDAGNAWGKILLVAAGVGIGWLLKKDPTPVKLLQRDGLEYLIHVVKEWRPVEYKSEKEYQGSLKQYLLGRFSADRLRVDSEYGFGRSRADIVIENEYGIELKYNLKDESEIKRVYTQMEEMKSAFTGALLLLCGKTSEDVYNRLKQDLFTQDENDDTICDVIGIHYFSSE